MLVGIMVGAIVNMRKLSNMSKEEPNNFLNKVTRYIFLKKTKDQFYQFRLLKRLRMKIMSKGISLNLVY